MAEAQNSGRSIDERFGDLNITGTTQDSTSDESSSVSTEATSDCRETASTTNAQGGVQCHGNCDGNPIYPNDKHIKRREGKEAILGSRQQFCAAFYHVNKWSYPERKLCCLDKDCKVFKRVRFTGNEKLQPKAVVGVAKYKIEGNNGVLYEARYTNCSKHQKHAEDFFRDDVKSGMLAATIDENKGGTLTIYLTLQPCNWSTTIKPEGTKVTRSDHSCCKTLTDIVTELQKNEVKLCVKPTHLCNLEIRDADINDDKDHEPHPDDPNIDAEAKYKHLQENAARGIKMLMKLNEENNDVDVSAMTKVDWEYLRRITDIDIQQSMSDDECNQRKELDRHIDNVIKKYKKKTGAKYR